MSRYLWLQTIGGRGGDRIDPAAIPADRLRAARVALDGALRHSAGGVPLPGIGDLRLQATAAGRALLASILTDEGVPLVTMAVAPREREGKRLWAAIGEAADRQGQIADFDRPNAPWAIVLAYPVAGAFAGIRTLQDLPLLEAELACAWLQISTSRS